MEPTKRRKVILTLFLIIALGNYGRINGTEDIRAIEFLSIFAIGALTALLLREILSKEQKE